ncbi:NAD(P)-binding protein [Rhodobacterales bacterium HKCCE2091]|nr:NAD(P)-binding protein [Rhodobacterales bacterium HKCCE2091]
MRIGIAGAGIGGLAAAAFLASDGHEVTVHDRFETPQPVGSGLVIQPVGREMLRLAGAEDAETLGQRVTRMEGLESDSGRVVLRVAYGKTEDRQGLAIHRAALHHALLGAAERAGARFALGHRVIGRDGLRLLFADGRSDAFDLVVDALGAGSVLSPLVARPLPYGAVWATLPWPDDAPMPPDMLNQRYRRADRMIGVLPVGRLPGSAQRLAAVFYSLPADGEAEWRARPFADWRAEALSLWPQMAAFLTDDVIHDAFTFARYGHGSLRRTWDEGIVHIGDAAHRASPQLGQGANMALLDARALQLALRDRPLSEALPRYASARRWHVAAYQALSASFTPQYQSDSRFLPVVRDRLLAPMSQVPPLPRILTRLVCGDLLPPMPALTPRAVRAVSAARRG